MITPETPITNEHRARPAASRLARDIMRERHPRTGLVTFLALGQEDLLTALILHEAHSGHRAPLGSLASRVFASPACLLQAELSSSPCAEARAIWSDALGARDGSTGAAMLLDLFAPLKSIERRAAA